MPPTFHSVQPKSVTNFMVRHVQESEFTSFGNRFHRGLETAEDTHIYTTEIYISVSPKRQKLPHFPLVGTTEFYFGFTKLGNNIVTDGFLEMPIYTHPQPLIRRGSTQNTHTLAISIFCERDPPTHVFISIYSNPTTLIFIYSVLKLLSTQ